MIGLLTVVVFLACAWFAVLWLGERKRTHTLREHAQQAQARNEQEQLALKQRVGELVAERDSLLRTIEGGHAVAAERDSALRRASELLHETVLLRARLEATGDQHEQRERLRAERAAQEHDLRTRRDVFETRFAQAEREFERLQAEVGALSEQAELQSFGLYRPYYDFGTSILYKAKLAEVRTVAAEMLKTKRAATCRKEWTVDGSVSKGRKLVERQLKLMLRAFNGECEAALGKVRFNNALALEQRLSKAFQDINELGLANECEIKPEYLACRLDELRIAYEHAEKVQQEREEQRRIREQMREEEVVQRELEAAQEDAEREEAQYERALAKAREELGKAGERDRLDLEARVAALQLKLDAAHEHKERALSMAQQTRAGHVYVISNEGSFGRNVFKVGMTRRLDPEDRVRELGGASVPFGFDVHAMIRCDDAPELERKLHTGLARHRVNQVNQRKEFFAVTLRQIEDIVTQCHGTIEFTQVAVAEDYRKTLAMRHDRPAGDQSAKQDGEASTQAPEETRRRVIELLQLDPLE